MGTEQLAAGYLAYVSTDEVRRESAEPEDAVREPTTSIASTHCIVSLDCGNNED
jgi:hypothetical protein